MRWTICSATQGEIEVSCRLFFSYSEPIARSGSSMLIKPNFYESYSAHRVDTMIHYSTLPCTQAIHIQAITTTVVSGIFCLLLVQAMCFRVSTLPAFNR